MVHFYTIFEYTLRLSATLRGPLQAYNVVIRLLVEIATHHFIDLSPRIKCRYHIDSTHRDAWR